MTPGPDGDDGGKADPRSVGLIGLIIVLVLAILALLLVRELGRQSKMQDCLMAGRTNCAPIEGPTRRY